MKYKEIVVFGVGGVGSWVANFVTRNNLCEKLTLVDYDQVEEKNLRRQDFSLNDVGKSKVKAIENNAFNYANGDTEEDIHVTGLNRQIRDTLDLTGIDKDALAIVVTDNIQSKRLIADHFDNFLIANCDKNFVEVKNFLDSSDRNAWDMGGGYSNEQDLTSNIFAANLLFYILKNNQMSIGKFHVRKRIEDDFANDIRRSHENVATRERADTEAV